jgi:ATP-dependent helicase/nuclease subunit A
MTRPAVRPLPDAAARTTAREALTRNVLVEAGAGSGKTSLMVDRIVALLQAGVDVGAIAAVTFTRKAATELRERLEARLDEVVAAGGGAAPLLAEARHGLDRAFVGTIHGFCGRILREHALSAGLSPDFQEVDEATVAPLAAAHLRRFAAAARRADDPLVQALEAVGLDPLQLGEAAALIDGNPDVTFPAPPSPWPDGAVVLDALEALLHQEAACRPLLLDGVAPDALTRTVERLQQPLALLDRRAPHDVAALLEPLAAATAWEVKVTRYEGGRKRDHPAKALKAAVGGFVEGPLADYVAGVRASRYAAAIAFATAVARDWQAERVRLGVLTFADLLRLTAALLEADDATREAVGTRWRHLLVDEFQDTDPLQAAVCLLLASPASEGTDWRTVTPRPGALFVVGDPKQSIYRFRRADIATYELVRERFRSFGAVVTLTANFRSTDAIGALVEAQFRPVFAAAPGASQAVFAPLETQQPAPAGTGVARYVVPSQRSPRAMVREDAARVASHIARAVAAGRTPAEFLVLTWTRSALAAHAEALAARNVPARVSGAAGALAAELAELRHVVQALVTPTDRLAVVTVLEGIFVGATPADLWAAHARGVPFVVDAPPPPGDDVVTAALARLHGWWQWTQELAPWAVVDRLLDATGLLVWAASQPLGDPRAGALLTLVERLRERTADGESLASVLALLADAGVEEDRDATLLPGDGGAVRVMNLHKAKGLEGYEVILAAPVRGRSHAPELVVRRDPATGAAIGGLEVRETIGMRTTVLAAPLEWAAWCEEEARLRREEEARLLYVAVTRAKATLLVGMTAGSSGPGGPWSALAGALDALEVPTMALPEDAAPGRRRVTTTLAALVTAEHDAGARRVAASRGRLVVHSVTEEAKRTAEEDDVPSWARPLVQAVADDADGRADGSPAAERATAAPLSGRAWGRAVHAALESALRAGADAAALAARLTAIAWHEGASLDDAARGVLVAQLTEVVDSVRRDPAWAPLTAPGGTVHAELALAEAAVDAAGVTVLREGILDAARVDDEGWTVVDWKSDRVGTAAWQAREPIYRRQVERYAALLSGISGRAAAGRLVRVAPDAGDG